MPIRFACPHCRQKLSVSTRRAGHAADCPRCRRPLTIPAAEPASAPQRTVPEAASALSADADEADSRGAAPSPDAAEPPLSFELDFESQELVYDAADETAPQASATAQTDLIAVPRMVLYLQGGLLAVVAIVSFVIGLIAGGALSGGGTVTEGSRACTLEGTIHYASGNRRLPDPGAVVAVIPDRGVRPDEKAPIDGLRPDDRAPEETHRGVAILRELGGSYSRADDRGRFKVQLPERGKYLVLVISNSRSVNSLDDIQTADLLKLGPFFENAAELLGRRRYQLTMETVRGNRQLNVVFE
jgi:hypothetical protein